MLSNSENRQSNDYSLLLRMKVLHKQGPQILVIVLFDWTHLFTTPSTALCINAALIAHVQAQLR